MLGQSFDLLDIEHRVGLHEGDFPLFLAAVWLLFCFGEGVGINHRIAALAFLDVCAKLFGLFEGHPVRQDKTRL